MDELGEALETLREVRHTPAVVEGPNDRKALEKLGFDDITELDGPLYAVVERLEEKREVSILTDLDAAGKKLYKYLYHELTSRGVKIDNRARIALFRTEIRQIEGLRGYV